MTEAQSRRLVGETARELHKDAATAEELAPLEALLQGESSITCLMPVLFKWLLSAVLLGPLSAVIGHHRI